MPLPTQSSAASTKQDERLSQLLQLKRGERPDDAFWQDFERDLRAKQLNSLVQIQPWYQRFARSGLYFARKAGTPALAATAIATALYVSSKHPHQEQEPVAASTPELRNVSPDEQPVFIVTAPAPEQELSPFATSAKTDYTVRSIARRSSTPAYQLEAFPVTLTSSAAEESQDLGAKVLKSKSHF